MDRCGIATSTRRVALKLWKNGLPTTRPLMDLVKQLYYAENKNKKNTERFTGHDWPYFPRD